MPDTPLSPTFDPKVLDGIIKDAKGEPGEVLGSIIASTAPPPTSSEERHSELEAKIIKECIKEYTKGGMYFAYNFGMVAFSTAEQLRQWVRNLTFDGFQTSLVRFATNSP